MKHGLYRVKIKQNATIFTNTKNQQRNFVRILQ